MERRYLANATSGIALEKRGADEGGILKGYAAVFYDGTQATEYELYSDLIERIMPSAFDRAIKEDDVRALFNHDPSLLLGRKSASTLSLAVDKVGLVYTIDLGQTTIAKDVREHVLRSDLQGSSFSFEVTDQRFIEQEKGGYIREILGVRLMDVGPVTFPAYEGTTVSARSEGGVEPRKAFDAFLAKEVARRRAMAARARSLEISS